MFGPESRNAPNIAIITLVCGWVFTALAIFAVFLCGWSRRFSLGNGEYCLFGALILAIVLVGHTSWAIIDEGMGYHKTTLSKSQRASLVKSIMANEILWTLVNGLMRFVAIMTIVAIFGSVKWIRYTSLSLSIMVGLHSLATVLTTLLICRPVAAAWDSDVSGECGDQVVAYVVLESVGALTDLMILIIPIPEIWKIRRPRQQKLGVSILLSVGVFVFIITGLRIQALHWVNAQDFSFSSGYLGLLSELGCLVGIICCCAPSLGPLIRRIPLWWTDAKDTYRFQQRDCTTREAASVEDEKPPVLSVLPEVSANVCNEQSWDRGFE